MRYLIRLAYAALTLALAPAAPAQDQPARATQPAPAPKQDAGKDDMSGMSMDQMMAHCAEMRAEAKAGKTLSSEMQRMMRECDKMDGQMQMPDATKER